jgi:4-hydroxybenzoyl-CoA thioesterase
VTGELVRVAAVSVPRPSFRAYLKVRFGDIDHAGIVYYPRFLHYFHVGLEEFFTVEVGTEYHTVINQERVGLPVVHLEIDFASPLRFGDEIEVEVRSVETGNTSVTWRYVVWKQDGVRAAQATIVTVCLDMDTFAKRPLPPWLRERFDAYTAAGRIQGPQGTQGTQRT